MPPPHRAMLLSVCLTSVAYIGPNSRTERHRKIKNSTEVAHVTRDSDTIFKVKGQLVADVLNSQHAATGATRRINTNILSTSRGRRHIVSLRAQLVIIIKFTCSFFRNGRHQYIGDYWWTYMCAWPVGLRSK